MLPTRDNFSLITSYVDFYWLRVHFVLGAAPGFSEVKPAIHVQEGPAIRSASFMKEKHTIGRRRNHFRSRVRFSCC